MSEFVIREMRPEDLEKVSTIYTLANPNTKSEEIEKWTKYTLEKYPNFSYVAEVEGKIVGGVSGKMRDVEVGFIDHLAVSVEYQGRGIGSDLISQVLKEFEKTGSKIVMLSVHYLCSAAIPFYYHHGFRICGSAQDYFGINHDAIMMRKKF